MPGYIKFDGIDGEASLSDAVQDAGLTIDGETILLLTMLQAYASETGEISNLEFSFRDMPEASGKDDVFMFVTYDGDLDAEAFEGYISDIPGLVGDDVGILVKPGRLSFVDVKIPTVTDKDAFATDTPLLTDDTDDLLF